MAKADGAHTISGETIHLPADPVARAGVIGQLVATIAAPDPKFWFETALLIGMDPIAGAPCDEYPSGWMSWNKRSADQVLQGFLTGWLGRRTDAHAPLASYIDGLRRKFLTN